MFNILLTPVDFRDGPHTGNGWRSGTGYGILARVVLLLFITHLKRRNGLLGRFRFLIRPRRRFTINILKLGLPVAAMNVSFAFISMTLARSASLYGGHLGITSQTTGGQFVGITWNTSTGFSTALGSFVAQNFAAGKMLRATRAFVIR